MYFACHVHERLTNRYIRVNDKQPGFFKSSDLPYCSGCNEGPPESFTSSLTKGPRKFYSIRSSFLISKRKKLFFSVFSNFALIMSSEVHFFASPKILDCYQFNTKLQKIGQACPWHGKQSHALLVLIKSSLCTSRLACVAAGRVIKFPI